MSRLPVCTTFAIAIACSFGVAMQGCKAKPSEEACRDAIHNIRKVAGQGTSDVGADPIAAIRSCRGNSSKEAVECMRRAKTLADLDACEGAVGEKYFREEAKQNAAKKEDASAADEPSETKAAAPATEGEAEEGEAEEGEAEEPAADGKAAEGEAEEGEAEEGEAEEPAADGKAAPGKAAEGEAEEPAADGKAAPGKEAAAP